MRRNSDADYAYLFMWRTEMAAPEYYGTREDEIQRQQSRRVRGPPQGVDLNAYYGITEQIVVLTADAGALSPTDAAEDTFHKENVARFVNAYGEVDLSFWAKLAPHLFPPKIPPSLLTEFSADPSTAPEGACFLRPDAIELAPPGPGSLELAFQYGP